MEWMTDPQAWIALATLTVLEIVLGVDNVIFIAILAGKLPKHQQDRARIVGLSLATFIRVGLLLSIAWMARLTQPLFTVMEHGVTGRDLILLSGGLFLIYKSVHEIHDKLEGQDHAGEIRGRATFASTITQILLLDIVFSLDSVITAVGMADHVPVMIAAIVIAIGFMLLFSGAISRFVDKHPTVKMLALSFLLLIGVALIAESFHHHIPKGYIYFAMAFSVFVEMLNLRLHKGKPVKLHEPMKDQAAAAQKLEDRDAV